MLLYYIIVFFLKSTECSSPEISTVCTQCFVPKKRVYNLLFIKIEWAINTIISQYWSYCGRDTVFANFANMQMTFRESETPAEGDLQTLRATRSLAQMQEVQCAVCGSVTRSITLFKQFINFLKLAYNLY